MKALVNEGLHFQDKKCLQSMYFNSLAAVSRKMQFCL